MKKEYIELTINSMCFFKFASISYLAKVKILITLRKYPKNLNMINLKKTEWLMKKRKKEIDA